MGISRSARRKFCGALFGALGSPLAESHPSTPTAKPTAKAISKPSNCSPTSRAKAQPDRPVPRACPLLLFLGSYAHALQDASEVIRRLPNKAEAYLIRAKAGKMLGQIPQALDDYSTSIRLRPSAEAHYGRGLTYVREYQGKDREALDDFTAAIRFDPKHVGAYKSRAEIYSRHEQFQAALDDSEKVPKLDPATPNAFCNVGFAHYALGHDAEGRKFLTTCYQKDPDPQTRGYYETEVRKVLAARQPRRNSGGGYAADGRESTAHDREMERQQHVYESLRSSGFTDRAEACRMDGSKC